MRTGSGWKRGSGPLPWACCGPEPCRSWHGGRHRLGHYQHDGVRALSTALYFAFAALGGLWVPPSVFAPALRDVARALPSYEQADLALAGDGRDGAGAWRRDGVGAWQRAGAAAWSAAAALLAFPIAARARQPRSRASGDHVTLRTTDSDATIWALYAHRDSIADLQTADGGLQEAFLALTKMTGTAYPREAPTG